MLTHKVTTPAAGRFAAPLNTLQHQAATMDAGVTARARTRFSPAAGSASTSVGSAPRHAPARAGHVTPTCRQGCGRSAICTPGTDEGELYKDQWTQGSWPERSNLLLVPKSPFLRGEMCVSSSSFFVCGSLAACLDLDLSHGHGPSSPRLAPDSLLAHRLPSCFVPPLAQHITRGLDPAGPNQDGHPEGMDGGIPFYFLIEG
ncbi:uncharacterized protein LOC133644339 [Entelurus aequoreus]|uniref:uncharacterized protein LOC133644339 n=1 Tax=Entelurus aequoreus TaxID=161455 RepID=UPI002B1D84DC|nr:uncharacterized protein LOC133644339 [Entelurus aequoreus]